MLTRIFHLFLFTLIYALTLFAAPASAPSADDLDNVVFEGVVRDASGGLIAGAKVTAIHSSTGVERTTTSTIEGRFRIAVSSPGGYKLRVVSIGFKEELSNETVVSSGRTVSIEFVLSAAGINEEISATASTPALVDTNRTVAGDTIAQRELEYLPIVNRDLLKLVFLLGGVAEPPLSTTELADEGRGTFLRGTPEEAGSFSLTGAPATSNNITIDGLDNNDDRSARERISLNVESIAELQIITNQYAAEYGRASGGRINIRTRSGSNSYRGDIYAYFNDESLDANTFFRNARGLGRVPRQQRREGGVVHGPIQKQKSFFMASYERVDTPDSVEINALVPVAINPLFALPRPNAAAVPGAEVGPFTKELFTPETNNILNARADFNLSQSHNAAIRFDLAVGGNKRSFPGGTRLPETVLIEGRDSDSISASDYLIAGDNIVNQARLQYSRLLPRNQAGIDSVSVVIKSPRLTGGGFTGSEGSPAFAREERRIQIQDNISLSRGPHLFKAGGDVQLVRSKFSDLFATSGEYTFDGVADFLQNNPSRFIQRFNTASRVSNNVAGVFVQDEWKIIPNFTLSFGARWDNESALDDRTNYSPRIALAWDPFGGKLSRKSRKLADPGKTVIRAGFGLFYNRVLLRTIDDFALGRATTIVDSDLNPKVLKNVLFPQALTDRILINRFGLAETQFLRQVSPDLKIPYTLQTGLGLERQLAGNLVASVDYIFTRGEHLWRESNINAPVLPAAFETFTEYLQSRDFDNRTRSNGSRPISGSNADVIRFDAGSNTSSSAGAIRTENGIRVLTLGLNAPRSSNIAAALNAIRFLRPDPSLTQVELLESTGNSFYHGGIFSIRYATGRVHFRAVYTLSKFVDEGTTNTASPQVLADRRAERALSLQDQRHRFTVSGVYRVPFVDLELSPTVSLGSSKPFNIGAGVDRNLNDIQNDRPDLIRQIGRPEWRRAADQTEDVKSSLELAAIGSSGNLPRNYGIGPGTRAINVRVSRTFSVRDSIRIRPTIDVFNVFNNTVFSFGSEFIDHDDPDFLVPKRTQPPRTVLLGLKVSF